MTPCIHTVCNLPLYSYSRRDHVVCDSLTGPQPQTIASRPYVWAESILQPSGSQWSSPSLLLNESVVLGSVRVRVEHFKLTGCATQYGVDFGSYQPVCVSPASEADGLCCPPYTVVMFHNSEC